MKYLKYFSFLLLFSFGCNKEEDESINLDEMVKAEEELAEEILAGEPIESTQEILIKEPVEMSAPSQPF